MGSILQGTVAQIASVNNREGCGTCDLALEGIKPEPLAVFDSTPPPPL